jgi:uncharacterized protein YjbI with pentapeptide repeats
LSADQNLALRQAMSREVRRLQLELNTDWSTPMKRFVGPLSLICMLLFAPAVASAETYAFSNIMDSTVPGAYFDFRDAAISGNKVAYFATFNPAGFGNIDSIFTSTGGPRTKVVQELTNAPPANGFAVPGTFSSIGRPSLSGDTVVFPAHVRGLFQGIDTDAIFTPGALAVGTQFFGSYPYQYSYKSVADPRISADVLMFRASLTSSSAPDSLYTKYGGRIVGVGDAAPGGTFTAIDAEYASSGDTAAFRGMYGAQEGIFSGQAGFPLTTIAKEGDPTPVGGAFQTLLDPAISEGNVAFVGTYAGGAGIFMGNGGALSAVIKTGDTTPNGNPISNLSTPAIGGNVVAFRADYSGGSGIFTSSGGALSKVIATGDPLFGSAVTSFAFTDMGLDAGGSGYLAFAYALANGRSGVAMAYTGQAPPTIYRLDGTPISDSAGLVTVPVVVLANRNLTLANLANADLGGADAQSANLTNASLNSAFLGDANLSNANLNGTQLVAAQLGGANFSGANVRGANFTRTVNVTYCSGGDPFCVPTINTSAGGISLPQLYTTASYQAHDLTDVRLAQNDLASADFSSQNLARADFTGAWLTAANFEGATIQGARFGRYTMSAGCEGKPAVDSCRVATNIIGTGISVAQLTSTASYLAHELASVDFSGNNLSGANLSGQNLAGASFLGTNLESAILSSAAIANVNFRNANLTTANLSGADARGADFTGALQAGANLANFIQPNGHMNGLDLAVGQTLVVRNYSGDPNRDIPLPPIDIKVDQHFAMSTGGTLKIELSADAWNSTISFAPGISVALDGTLELGFATGDSHVNQIGRTFDLFDWSGVTPAGNFVVSSTYTWNLDNLYTTGEVTLLAIPFPGDFNHDGAVDTADYVVWRKTGGSPDGYAIWRTHFGNSTGSGVHADSSGSVPEPATPFLLLITAAVMPRPWRCLKA